MNIVSDLGPPPIWLDDEAKAFSTRPILPREKEAIRYLKSRAREIHPTVLNKFPENPPRSGYRPIATHRAHQEILSTVIRIKEMYNERGFLCFVHGTQAGRAPLFWTKRALAKLLNPKRDFKFSECLLDEDPSYKTMADLLEGPPIDDHKPDLRRILLCADACFTRRTGLESAYSFCGSNISMRTMKNSPETELLFEGIACESAREPLREEFLAIVEEFGKQPCGCLVVVCIPEAKVKDCVYRSHPRGMPCHDVPPEHDLDILWQFQKDQAPLELPYDRCRQYRIVWPLIPEETRSFLIPPNPQMAERYKARCKALARNIALARSRPKDGLETTTIPAQTISLKPYAQALGVAGAIFLGAKALLTIAKAVRN